MGIRTDAAQKSYVEFAHNAAYNSSYATWMGRCVIDTGWVATNAVVPFHKRATSHSDPFYQFNINISNSGGNAVAQAFVAVGNITVVTHTVDVGVPWVAGDDILVIARKDAANLKIFVWRNRVFKGTSTTVKAGTITQYNTEVDIGVYGNLKAQATWYNDVIYEDSRLYNRALSDEEIMSIGGDRGIDNITDGLVLRMYGHGKDGELVTTVLDVSPKKLNGAGYATGTNPVYRPFAIGIVR